MEVDEEEWGWMRGRQCRGGGVWEGVFVDNCGSLYVNFGMNVMIFVCAVRAWVWYRRRGWPREGRNGLAWTDKFVYTYTRFVCVCVCVCVIICIPCNILGPQYFENTIQTHSVIPAPSRTFTNLLVQTRGGDVPGNLVW